jgi:hypothetical protein
MTCLEPNNDENESTRRKGAGRTIASSVLFNWILATGTWSRDSSQKFLIQGIVTALILQLPFFLHVAKGRGMPLITTAEAKVVTAFALDRFVSL